MWDQSKAITVVSGMPRSGTSLMMRILEAAGMPLLVDGVRGADVDNPHGYFEFEPVKALPAGGCAWLEDAAGRVVKIIYRLLPYLPPSKRYDIVFMERSLVEVLRSQERMVARLGAAQPLVPSHLGRLAEAFRGEVQRVLRGMQERPGVRLMTVSHAALLSQPERPLAEVCRFLSIDSRKISAMQAMIEPALYRSRPPRLEPSVREAESKGAGAKDYVTAEGTPGSGDGARPWH